MQSIKHSNNHEYLHPIFRDFESFYCATSEREPKASLVQPQFNIEFETLQNVFNEVGKCSYGFEYLNKRYDRLRLPTYDSKNLILCFSGGKDSTAAAVHYKQMGYNIVLYHVKHINKILVDEHEHAQKIADYLELPIVYDDITLSGHKDWQEHPLKNAIIANDALQWGIRNNFSRKIAFGNYITQTMTEGDFGTNAGDCIDMWEEYEYIMQAIIPNFKMYIFLNNYYTTFKILMKDPKLLDLCVSCYGPYRVREYNRQRLSTKYGIKIKPHRCGCCVKCALEYIYMADHNLTEFNENYYTYCMEVCYNSGVRSGVMVQSIDELWDSNMFYPMKKSRMYNQLKDSGIIKNKLVIKH